MALPCLLATCAHVGEFVPPAGDQPSQILRCERNTPVVGAGGATFRTPAHELRIPRGLLPDGTTVTFHAMGGDTTGVRVSVPAPRERLDPPLTLVIDARRCSAAELQNASIWRLPDGGGAPTPVPTRRRGFLFFGEITETSGFIIAN